MCTPQERSSWHTAAPYTSPNHAIDHRLVPIRLRRGPRQGRSLIRARPSSRWDASGLARRSSLASPPPPPPPPRAPPRVLPPRRSKAPPNVATLRRARRRGRDRSAHSADDAVAAALDRAGLHVVLGSKSSTRRAILTEIGVSHEIVTADIDEKAIRRDDPKELVLALADAKADAIVARLRTDSSAIKSPIDDALLITADQVVVAPGSSRSPSLRLRPARSSPATVSRPPSPLAPSQSPTSAPVEGSSGRTHPPSRSIPCRRR